MRLDLGSCLLCDAECDMLTIAEFLVSHSISQTLYVEVKVVNIRNTIWAVEKLRRVDISRRNCFSPVVKILNALSR